MTYFQMDICMIKIDEKTGITTYISDLTNYCQNESSNLCSIMAKEFMMTSFVASNFSLFKIHTHIHIHTNSWFEAWPRERFYLRG